MSGEQPAGAGERGGRWAEFAAWAALFCAARWALVLAFGDVFAYLEEAEKAAAGVALLSDLGLERAQLAYHPYEGGGFVISHLDALVFAALGPSVLALKFVAIALGVVLLAVVWRLALRAGGLVCARVVAALFVFAPASVQQTSLLALGIHFHALIFVAALLLGAFAVLEGAAPRRAVWWWTGLAAGFGLFFNYQLALTNAVALGAVVVLARRERQHVFRGLPLALAGAALGLAPLAWMAWNTGAAVFDIHGADPLASDTSKRELLSAFASSLWTGRSGLERAALLAVLLAPWCGLVAFTQRGALRTLAALVAAHAALFAAAYVGLGFTVGRVAHYFLLQRLMPVWFLGLLATGCGVAALWRSGARKLALALALAPALVGASDLARMLAAAQPHDWSAHAQTLATTKAHAYAQYLQKIAPRSGLERVELARRVQRFDEEDREWLGEALANGLYGGGNVTPELVQAELAQAGWSDAASVWRCMGLALRNAWGGDIAARLERARAQPPEQQAALFEAIGRFGNRFYPTADLVERELAQGLAAAAPREFFFGLGLRMWSVRGDARRVHYHEPASGPWCFDTRAFDALAAAQSPEIASALRAGFEHASALARLDGRDTSR
jgi:hypothetical protein